MKTTKIKGVGGRDIIIAQPQTEADHAKLADLDAKGLVDWGGPHTPSRRLRLKPSVREKIKKVLT